MVNFLTNLFNLMLNGFMYQILISTLLVIFFFNCKQSSPCSPFDTSCTPLGYIIPDLLKPKTATTGTGAASRLTFTGLNYLTIMSATSVRLDWTAATSSATGSIE
jgi:hypothetical protein